MGNCTGRSGSKDRLSMQSREQQIAKIGNLRKCQSEHPIDSPISDNGEIISKSNRNIGSNSCRIPILKDNFTTNSTLLQSKGSYKSVLFDRPTSSRIPITSTTVVCRKSATISINDGDQDNSQYNESGFASDLSVTTSSFSQMNTESKSVDTLVDDRSDETMTRNNKLPNKPTYLNFRNRGQATIINDVNACASTMGPITPQMVLTRQSTSSTKSVSSYNTDNKLKRPQSISTETEVLLNKSQSKRCSEGSDILSPSVSMHEHSAVMQDLSSLKLMLHKLKRYLTQDGDDRCFDGTNDGVFRQSPPSSTNIKSLTREELEQKYELLFEQNVNLEKLLQSRERVIAKLQTEKLQISGWTVQQSAYGDNQESRVNSADQPSYHWSNLKLPQSHS